MFVLFLLIVSQRNAPCVKQNSIEYNFLFNAFRLSLGKDVAIAIDEGKFKLF